MSTGPAKHDFFAFIDADWGKTLTITDTTSGDPIDITDYTFDMDIRDPASGASIASPTITITDATGGEISLALTNATLGALSPKRAEYDLKKTSPGGNVEFVLYGTFDFIKTSSRDA